MIPLSDFYPRIRLGAIRIPAPVLDRAILDAVRFLCDETWVQEEDLALFNAAQDQGTYTLAPPDDMEIIVARDLEFDGVPLRPRTLQWLRKHMPKWRALDSSTPRLYTSLKPAEITLIPAPDANLVDGIFVRAAVRPAYSATQVEDQFLTEFGECVINGAMFFVFSQNDKDWTDQSLAKNHNGVFMREISKAKIRQQDSFTSEDLRMDIPRIT